jgi:hypothetical protein
MMRAAEGELRALVYEVLVPKSLQVEAVDTVQKALHAKLKAAGFKKKGRTFNRTTEDGLVQVINIQMGSFDPPGTTYIPGLRENLYGWFTLNLGIYVPEVAKHRFGSEAKAFVQEYSCCIRSRLGSLGGEESDLWWRNDAGDEVLPDLIARLDRDGLPFLARYATRDAILRELKGKSENPGFCFSPPRIITAIILVERGERAEAKRLLAEQAGETGVKGHSTFVRLLAEKLGIALVPAADLDEDVARLEALLRRKLR